VLLRGVLNLFGDVATLRVKDVYFSWGRILKTLYGRYWECTLFSAVVAKQFSSSFHVKEFHTSLSGTLSHGDLLALLGTSRSLSSLLYLEIDDIEVITGEFLEDAGQSLHRLRLSIEPCAEDLHDQEQDKYGVSCCTALSYLEVVIVPVPDGPDDKCWVHFLNVILHSPPTVSQLAIELRYSAPRNVTGQTSYISEMNWDATDSILNSRPELTSVTLKLIPDHNDLRLLRETVIGQDIALMEERLPRLRDRKMLKIAS